jgi:hypothetical protein
MDKADGDTTIQIDVTCRGHAGKDDSFSIHEHILLKPSLQNEDMRWRLTADKEIDLIKPC